MTAAKSKELVNRILCSVEGTLRGEDMKYVDLYDTLIEVEHLIRETMTHREWQQAMKAIGEFEPN